MKLVYQFFFLGIFSASQVFGQTTATDFNVKDCIGTDRHLFADLDAGKIIVMSMVHPCGSCVAPTKSAKTVVNTFSSTYPGRVQFYVVDDFGDNPCSSLSSWATQYSISGAIMISNPAVNQNQYGSPGMPKIVVVGGSDHKVWFVQDNGLNTANLGKAIGQALAATGLEKQTDNFQLSLYPNPVNQELEVSWVQTEKGNMNYTLYNIQGTKVIQGEWLASEGINQERTIQTDQLPVGLYFITLSKESKCSTLRFSIVR